MSGIKWNDDYSAVRANLPLLLMLLVCLACMGGIIAWFIGETY
jgi:hypothetical protein